MPYKIEIIQENAYGTQARYRWTLLQWSDTPIPSLLSEPEHWAWLDSGDSKYKWNAKRAALRAMKRAKKKGTVEEGVVFEKEFE